MASTAETFQSFLSGLSKRLFCGESELTDEALKTQLYPEMPLQEFERLTSKSISLLKAIVQSEMDMKQLDAFLTSHMKRKEGGIEEWQAKAFLEYWRTHKNKIKSALVDSVRWHSKCKSFNWRTDTKLLGEANIPVAILQFQLQEETKTRNVVFEADEEQLKNLLLAMGEMQKKLAEFKE